MKSIVQLVSFVLLSSLTILQSNAIPNPDANMDINTNQTTNTNTTKKDYYQAVYPYGDNFKFKKNQTEKIAWVINEDPDLPENNKTAVSAQVFLVRAGGNGTRNDVPSNYTEDNTLAYFAFTQPDMSFTWRIPHDLPSANYTLVMKFLAPNRTASIIETPGYFEVID